MGMKELGPRLLSWASIVDDNTIAQARQISEMDFVDPHVALMPDAHHGLGSSVGTVIPTVGAVIPAAVGVDIGCLDRETEVLTPAGWVRISEWDGDEILIYDPNTDEASFEIPDRYIVGDCAEFYHFKNSKGLDQMLSEEHRVAVWSGAKSRGYRFGVMSPEQLASQRSLEKCYHCFKTTFSPTSPGIALSDELIRVEIMVQADGRVREFSGRNHVELHFSRTRKIQRAIRLLDDAGIEYKETRWKDGSTAITFAVPTDRCTKNFGRFWLASVAQLRVIADEVMFWDGHRGYRSHYTSTDRSCADVVQFAFAATGIRAGIHTREGQKAHHNRTHQVIPTRNEMVGFAAPVMVPSVDGKKYCFTVRTGFFVARRGGKIFITGNCGMIAVETCLSKTDIADYDLRALRLSLQDVIPVSMGGYNTNLERFEFTGDRITELESLAQEITVDLTHSPKWKYQLGSLGSGNHFLEVCWDERGIVWLFLHSGSRGVGNKTAQRHIRIAQEYCAARGIILPHKDLAYLVEGTDEFDRYILDLAWAQRFAFLNRAEMMDRFVWALRRWLPSVPGDLEVDRINTHHNYTQQEVHFGNLVWLTRKGAINAHVGVKGLIPGSMSTGSYVVEGLGNPVALCSAPHGAGRKFSRTEARRRYTVEDLAERMRGIEYVPGETFVDEIQDAYKDVHTVIEDSATLVRVVHEFHQLMNMKGS